MDIQQQINSFIARQSLDIAWDNLTEPIPLLNRNQYEAARLTKELCGNLPSGYPRSEIEERWEKLAELWLSPANNPGIGNVFKEVVRRTATGKYSTDYTDAQRELLTIIAYEMLQNGAAHRIWATRNYYFKAINEAFSELEHELVPETPYSTYLLGKAKWLLQDDRKNYTYQQNNDFAYFEAVIKLLLPEAADWTDEWFNKEAVLAAIADKWGFSDPATVEKWLGIFAKIQKDYRDSGKTTESVMMMALPEMPERLIRAIWPQDTAVQLRNLVKKFYNQMKQEAERQKLQSVLNGDFSRIWVVQWLDEKTGDPGVPDAIRKEIKRMIFDLQMRG